MGTSLICFAVPEEAKFFRVFVAGRSEVTILVTGIGARNSEQALRAALSTQRPDFVLTCGFAGGLDPTLRCGDVIFDAESESPLSELLAQAGVKPARFFCADRVLTTVAEKAHARQTTGADAVEMESSVIRSACRAAGIPSATVRVISDTAGETLPLDFNRLMTADQKIHFGKLAFALAKSPEKIPALLRLQRQTNLAARNLASLLAKVVSAVPR